jgi:heme-degrading monooxygenase HmoA
MIAVIFEVEPHPAGYDEYLERAAALAGDLQGIDGFISIERYRSLSSPERLLSLSWWRDEAAIAAWRAHPPHAAARARGDSVLFRHWRIRVAEVLRERSAQPEQTRCGDRSARPA